MKVLGTAVSIAVVSALVLSACAGSDDPEGSDTPSTASVAAGGRETSSATLSHATIAVKGKHAYLVGTIANTGAHDVKLQSLYADGFKLAEVGELADGRVTRPEGGVTIKHGEDITLGTKGLVARFAVPDAQHRAGDKLTVNLNFDDNSQVAVEATLTADVAPA